MFELKSSRFQLRGKTPDVLMRCGPLHRTARTQHRTRACARRVHSEGLRLDELASDGRERAGRITLEVLACQRLRSIVLTTTPERRHLATQRFGS